MGMFDFLFPKVEERAIYNTGEATSPVDQAFSLDGLLNTEAITEDKIMRIPTVKACVSVVSGTIAQMPIYLYKQNVDGSIEKVEDNRVSLINHESNTYLSGYNLKRNMVKDYLLHGASYVAKYEAGNTILELHPLPASSVLVNKRVQNGYRTVGAEIVLSTAEAGAYNEQNKILTKFKPHEVMIALQETHDGLTSKGALYYGQELFKQALSEMEYTKNLYENGALPLGLLKTAGRLNETQADALRASWRKLYSGVKNSAKTVVLQEGMEYEALSMNPNEIQMNDTKAHTNSEICKLFNIPESLVNAKADKQYVSIEQNNIHFLRTALSPIISAFEGAMDKSLLLESEKAQGYFFRFDTAEITRTTEKERVETTVAAVTGRIFTVNEARAKFDLPPLEEKDTQEQEIVKEDQPNEKDVGTESQ